MAYRFFILVLMFPFYVPAQEMQRRSFLGTRLESVTADVQRVMELPNTQGVLITEVLPGSTAETTGFKKSDILLNIDGKKVENPQMIVDYIAEKKGDRHFTYELLRSGKKISGEATLKPYPLEQYSGIKVSYTQVTTASGQNRVIITRPQKDKKYPTVVFLGGYGCYSLDLPLDTNRGELQLLRALTRAGYTTVRIEKPGMGDAAGVSRDCNTIGFLEEANVYAKAIKELSTRDEINVDELFIFGHSMGGVMAPLVAMQVPVRGIIAYGTIGSNFMEYLAKTRRTIAQAYNMEPDSADAYIKEYCDCAAYYFVNSMTTEEAAAKDSRCRQYLSVFDDRSRLYNKELYALNIPGIWRNFKGNALLIWGESDYIASREDHMILAEAVNHYGNGKATFATLPSATHGMQYAANFREAQTAPGNYTTALNKMVIDWLKENSQE